MCVLSWLGLPERMRRAKFHQMMIEKKKFLLYLSAGAAGSCAHYTLLFFKHELQLFPDFEPYEIIQKTITSWAGDMVPSWILIMLAYLNGSLVLGFLFNRSYLWLPTRNGPLKGLFFAGLAWLALGIGFFPLLGFGPFGVSHSSFLPLFTFFMLAIYCVVMGSVRSFFKLSKNHLNDGDVRRGQA